MDLTHHQTAAGGRWALDGCWLPTGVTLAGLLAAPAAELLATLTSLRTEETATGPLLPPIEAMQEVWASGVTYLRSRDARKAESQVADVYERVYTAERPELFFKAAGWRVVGPGRPIRVRRDSTWNVPEPELTLVANRRGEIVGYTAGNDVSSRDIEGANPLYLPQAKVYNAACALGPSIRLASAAEQTDLPIRLEVWRGGVAQFTGETRTSQIRRGLDELVGFLQRELDFPQGVFLMTGTGIVPPDDTSLQAGDTVRLAVGELWLENPVEG
ncbi:MAG: fumarylacetoacetate hydrolase family protein [Anaerolineales bacterium]|nr:fumarylacetoacetate hydrolase family protein [Anaerolineales bacterium]